MRNIRDNKLKQASLNYFFYTEKLTDRVLWNCQPIYNQTESKFNGLVLCLFKIGMKYHGDVTWRYLSDNWQYNIMTITIVLYNFQPRSSMKRLANFRNSIDQSSLFFSSLFRTGPWHVQELNNIYTLAG